MMQIERDKVVFIHYTLRDDSGKVLDSSSGRDPLGYLHGGGNIVSGLEQALDGKRVGDKFSVSIAPIDGYGEHDADLVQKVPRRAFQGMRDIKPGMQVQAQTPQGARTFTIKSVVGDMVNLDGNHPLAGQTLNFEIAVTDIRDASPEEIEHGHIHGVGGHHH
jgi:FKBP-type peptidyl-prolyl cis-trans isomerase SlyD